MEYKILIQKIIDLPWEEADPTDLIILSRGTAIEFAESLRFALELYPNDVRLKEMADGELKTHNMDYQDYLHEGDHWEYLDHFISKHKLKPSSDVITKSIQSYTEAVRNMRPEERAMTVFSREEELVHIFRKIVKAHDWNALEFDFYRYYLEAHIEFDSGEGGHHHLTAHFLLHETVLAEFYKIRLKLYSALFS